MRGSTTTLRADAARSRFALEAERHPEWRAWLDALELAVGSIDDARWAGVRVVGADTVAPSPLLHDASISADPRVLFDWWSELLAATPHADASNYGRALPLALRLDAPDVFERAVRQEAILLAGDAEQRAAITALAHLAVLPILHACRRQLHDRRPASWTRGCCPLCGAWPLLAELRGLDRTRSLRCGRCGEDWAFEVLLCPFCLERDHRRLTSLMVEGADATQRIDACSSCDGYLKSFTTLTPIPDWALLLEDAATVALDLVAGERALARPERPAFPLSTRIVVPGAESA